jgi:hypothetical protein
MAAKILLSVSPLFWLLLFCSDSGLEGVRASPLSKTSANRLDALRSLYPKKTSFINETLSQDEKIDPKLIELVELLYAETDFPDRPGSIINLSASYPAGGWTIGSLYANIDWVGTVGSIVLSGGPAQDNWAVTLEIPDGLVALHYEIYVTLFRVVSKHFFLS